jgi:hypothetical protein
MEPKHSGFSERPDTKIYFNISCCWSLTLLLLCGITFLYPIRRCNASPYNRTKEPMARGKLSMESGIHCCLIIFISFSDKCSYIVKNVCVCVCEWAWCGVVLRHCATSRKVPGSIPSGVTGDFFRGIRQFHVPGIDSASYN